MRTLQQLASNSLGSPGKPMPHSMRRTTTRPPPEDMGEEIARMIVERMRAEIDRRYENPSTRESAWRSFLAMAGDWATEDGVRRPGAYQALKPIVEKLREMMQRKTGTTSASGFLPIARRDSKG